jgi:hypothetical protein
MSNEQKLERRTRLGREIESGLREAIAYRKGEIDLEVRDHPGGTIGLPVRPDDSAQLDRPIGSTKSQSRGDHRD